MRSTNQVDQGLDQKQGSLQCRLRRPCRRSAPAPCQLDELEFPPLYIKLSQLCVASERNANISLPEDEANIELSVARKDDVPRLSIILCTDNVAVDHLSVCRRDCRERRARVQVRESLTAALALSRAI